MKYLVTIYPMDPAGAVRTHEVTSAYDVRPGPGGGLDIRLDREEFHYYAAGTWRETTVKPIAEEPKQEQK